MERLCYINLIEFLLQIEFETAKDQDGEEYVLLKRPFLNRGGAVFRDLWDDKTLCEVTENRIRLFESISKEELPFLVPFIKKLGVYMMKKLTQSFPERKFLLYAEADIGNELSVTFHHLWDGEEGYRSFSECSDSILYRFRLEGNEIIIESSLGKAKDALMERINRRTEYGFYW